MSSVKNLARAIMLVVFAATALAACSTSGTGGDARGVTASPYDAPWFNRSPG